MTIIALKGAAVTNLHVANNIGGAEYVRISNISAAEKLITVATVLVDSELPLHNTYPGTVTLESLQSVVIQKGTTDTVQVPGDNATTAHATAVSIVTS